MQMAELLAYAKEKYQIEEQRKWPDFPGFSVLCHPQTGKWLALLMRQWDHDTGTGIERCDLKCGIDSLQRLQKPYLSKPFRMRGNRWISVSFDDRAEYEVILQLFDRAIALGKPYGYTVVLDSQFTGGENQYQETALPFAESSYRPEKEKIPDRLREMRRLYEYGRETAEARAKNFYRQAVFMRDYEDDLPWTGDFVCYYPTYHDLSIRQLRGYFTWRTLLRRGVFQPVPASAAYLYVYELLNSVGAATPADAMEKLREFEQGYLDSGIGDRRMRSNLRRWMLEFSVLHNLPPEQARQNADPELVERDEALTVLRFPDAYSDAEVFSSLCRFGGKKTKSSPVLANDPEHGNKLFAESWRKASAYRREGKDLFTLCFGEKTSHSWYPLSNVVYYEKSGSKDRDYILDDCRSYRLRRGLWQEESFEKTAFDLSRLQGFLHETDARLRRYLKTGRFLRENMTDEWAVPYIDAVIEEDRKARINAARPKITIDLSGLEQIRRDALTTRDSLLTEEELDDPKQYEETAEAPENSEPDDIPLNRVEMRIVRALLEGCETAEIMKENHIMPSVAADAINEALFDEFGDTVVLCEEEKLFLVDDYIDELKQYLGGRGHG